MWKKLEGPKTLAAKTPVADDDDDESEHEEDYPDESPQSMSAPPAPETHEKMSDDSDTGNQNKRRKVTKEEATPVKSDTSSTSRKSRRQTPVTAKPKQAYQLRVKLKGDAQSTAADETLAYQHSLCDDVLDPEAQNLLFESLCRMEPAKKPAPQQRAAAVAAASSFSRQLGSSSESTASETVFRHLFSPGSASAGDSSSRPQKLTTETEQLGTLTP